MSSLRRRLALPLLCAGLACASPPPPEVVPDAVGIEAVSGSSASCSKPFELARDCSILTGATRSLVIGNMKIKSGASSDGKVVLIMPAGQLGLAFGGPEKLTAKSNEAYRLVKEALAARDVSVVRATPMLAGGGVQGYYLELSADGYEVLLEYAE